MTSDWIGLVAIVAVITTAILTPWGTPAAALGAVAILAIVLTTAVWVWRSHRS